MPSPCTAGTTGTLNVLSGFTAPPGTPPGPVVVNPDGTVSTGDFQPARVPVTVLTLTANQTPIPTPFNNEIIAFDTAIADTFTNAPGDGSILISLPGYYQLNCAIEIAGSFWDGDSDNEWQLAITVNGVGVAYWSKFYKSGTGAFFGDTGVAANIRGLQVGDSVRAYINHQGPQSPGGLIDVVGLPLPDSISYLSASYIGKL